MYQQQQASNSLSQHRLINTIFNKDRLFRGRRPEFIEFIQDIKAVSEPISTSTAKNIMGYLYRPAKYSDKDEENRLAKDKEVIDFNPPPPQTQLQQLTYSFDYDRLKNQLASLNHAKQTTKGEQTTQTNVGMAIMTYLLSSTGGIILTKVEEINRANLDPSEKAHLCVRSIRQIVLPPGTAQTLSLGFVEKLATVPLAFTLQEAQDVTHQVQIIYTMSKDTCEDFNSFYNDALKFLREKMTTIRRVIDDADIAEDDKIVPRAEFDLLQQQYASATIDQAQDTCAPLSDRACIEALLSRFPSHGPLGNLHNVLKTILNQAQPSFLTAEAYISKEIGQEEHLATVARRATNSSAGITAYQTDIGTIIHPHQQQSSSMYHQQPLQISSIASSQDDESVFTVGRQPRIDKYPAGLHAGNCGSSCLNHLSYDSGCTSKFCTNTDHYIHDIGKKPELKSVASKVGRYEQDQRNYVSNDRPGERQRGRSAERGASGNNRTRERSNSTDSKGSKGSQSKKPRDGRNPPWAQRGNSGGPSGATKGSLRGSGNS